ncbi:D-alanyl-D-alanine carboxypeptidase family protein [Saccharibacillus alkalitolerans]|uniref:serine-type D-Ala-D-Ala carboxypeptidase n=1 Tax=Saccharibacillus alkalitolerans TaxID=2705290 RepID=A0ABX0FDX2_9BACL|nr:D-alanyl-D-alanine carboxypeptidase family protein [Saccharibacillus alkalitolerans]NGZ78194.1 D-alanyl-D-alanine carboxypeptidase [Saccharibacillus alkalitolerans]
MPSTYKSKIEKNRISPPKFLKRSAASVLLIHMLCLSVVPANLAGAAADTTQTQTKTESKAAAPAAAKAIPTVESLNLAVKSAVLLEPTTGEVILSLNADTALPPASMTKMMTEYIVAEQVKQGKMSWDDIVTVGKNAAAQVGSRVFLAEGDQHSVKDLYIAMAIGSANDATVALAETVAPTEQEFVKLMNSEAKRMGMKTAHFANSTGLDIADMPADSRPSDGKETVMSAMDAAILAKYIVTDHPDFNEFTTLQSYQFREGAGGRIENLDWMLEANASVPNFKAYAYEGLDGLKTGHTNAAGNNFTGTAVRDGMRLISVVMGTDVNNQGSRFVETRKVLDYGFNNFEIKEMVAANKAIEGEEPVAVSKGKEESVSYETAGALSFVVPKGADASGLKVQTSVESGLEAPVAKGDKVGTATYTYQAAGMAEPQTKTVDLVASADVEKAGWFKQLLRAIGGFFSDLFEGIKNLF